MKKKWSGSWVSSTQPRKQRKFVHNAPLHVRHKFVSAHLAPVLRERYGTRSVAIRKGDKVKVLRGESKGFTGAVEKVVLKKALIYIEGLKTKKVDGKEVLKPLKPSNVMIIELNTSDKRRQSKLLKGGEIKPEKKAKPDAKEPSEKKEQKTKASSDTNKGVTSEKKAEKAKASKKASEKVKK